MPLNNGAFYGYGYYRTLIENPVLEIKPTGQHVFTATKRWPIRQRNRRRRRFKRIRQVAAPWICPVQLSSAAVLRRNIVFLIIVSNCDDQYRNAECVYAHAICERLQVRRQPPLLLETFSCVLTSC